MLLQDDTDNFNDIITNVLKEENIVIKVLNEVSEKATPNSDN